MVKSTTNTWSHVQLLSYGAAGFAFLTLAGLFATDGDWLVVLLLAAITGIWAVGAQQHWERTTNLLLIGNTVAAVVGAWWGLLAPVLLIGIIATLVAWDLQRFAARLRSVGVVDNARRLVRGHLVRILLIAAPGLAFGILGMLVRLSLPFAVVLLLTLLAAGGLIRALTYLRRAST